MPSKTMPIPARAGHRPERILVLIALAVGMLVATALDAQQAERYVLGGDRVALYNLVGTVTVEPGTGSDVVVELRRGGRDAAELEVDVGSVEGAEALRVLYPEGRIVYPALNVNRFRTTMDSDSWWGGLFGRRSWEVVRSGRGTEAWADATVRVPAGKHVLISLTGGTMVAEGIRGDVVLDGGPATATARRIRGSLVIDLGSGTARAENIEGDLLIDTGSGDVVVENVRGGSVRLDTGSGSVGGSGIDGELVVDTGSGDVTLSAVTSRDILIDTGSGDVRLSLAGDVDDVEIDTGSGDVTVVLGESLGAELTVDTGSGGIDVDVPIYVVERDRSFLRADIGDGRGEMVIDTGSGGVRLRGS